MSRWIKPDVLLPEFGQFCESSSSRDSFSWKHSAVFYPHEFVTAHRESQSLLPNCATPIGDNSTLRSQMFNSTNNLFTVLLARLPSDDCANEAFRKAFEAFKKSHNRTIEAAFGFGRWDFADAMDKV